MPRDGAGNYSLPQPAFTPNAVISSTAVNSDLSDIATALTGSLAANGEKVPTANQPMGNFKHTNVGAATFPQQYAQAGQILSGAILYAGITGGTSTALTGTLNITPAAPGLYDGQTVVVRIGTTCGDLPTFNLNSAGAKKLYVNSAAGPVQAMAGDLAAGNLYRLGYSTALDSAAGGWVVFGASIASRGTQVFMGSPQAIPSGAVTTLTAWSAANFNELGAWVIGSPSRLTVPTGVSRVSVEFSSSWSYVGSAGAMTILILKNGSLARGADTRAAFNGTQACVSRTDNVVAGDYFEAQVFQSTGGTINFVGSGDSVFTMTAIR